MAPGHRAARAAPIQAAATASVSAARPTIRGV
jgi:hypothetical protein